jgi:hypothetical protein
MEHEDEEAEEESGRRYKDQPARMERSFFSSRADGMCPAAAEAVLCCAVLCACVWMDVQSVCTARYVQSSTCRGASTYSQCI